MAGHIESRDPDREASASVIPVREIAQRSIQSVELGFRLIQCLEEAPGSLSLKELSARAGMPASKAHLYLVSFRRVGLIVQEEVGGRYNLGPYALQLGLAALRKLDVGRIAGPLLEELSAGTGESSYLAVWGNRGPCIIIRADGARPSPMSLQVGYVLPVVSTATGRIFLSYLPRSTIAAVLDNEVSGPDARKPAGDAAKLDRIIAETRAIGMARTDSLLNTGFTALSAPILSHDRALAGAITIIGPSGQMDADFSGAGAVRLRQVADSISGQLGLKQP